MKFIWCSRLATWLQNASFDSLNTVPLFFVIYVRFSIRANASDLQTLQNCHPPLSLFEVFWHSRVEPKRCQDLQKTPFIYYYQLLVLNFLQPWLVLYIVQNSFVELDMSVILLRNLSSCFDRSTSIPESWRLVIWLDTRFRLR